MCEGVGLPTGQLSRSPIILQPMARRHTMDAKIYRTDSTRARVAAPHRATCTVALAVGLAAGYPVPSFASGDAVRGATIYHDCMICHSLDKNGIGPRHRGVFGNKAASVPNYAIPLL